jgi:hypothetical protein
MAQDNPTNNWNSASDTGTKPGGTSGLGTTGTSGSNSGGSGLGTSSGSTGGSGSLGASSSGSGGSGSSGSMGSGGSGGSSGGTGSSFGSGSSGLGSGTSSSGGGFAGGTSGGFGTGSGTSGLGGGTSTGTGVSSGGALGTQSGTDSGVCPHCGQALKSGGLEQFLGRLGITEDMIGNLKGQFQNVDIDEYLNTARDYLKDGSTRATSYAKDNPGKVAAGVAALALGAGLIYAAVNRDKD